MMNSDLAVAKNPTHFVKGEMKKTKLTSEHLPTVAEFLSKSIDNLRGVKSQQLIAEEMGYEKPNIISMLKKGQTPLPLERVESMAIALQVDPALLFRIALNQRPGLLGSIERTVGPFLTNHEVAVVNMLREEIGAEKLGDENFDMEPVIDRMRNAIRNL